MKLKMIKTSEIQKAEQEKRPLKIKLKQGTYLDTTVKEYRAWPAINYSSLADFSESQDHALIEKPAKSYFEEGTAFELMIEDRAKGTGKFLERFFVADAPGTMPENLAQWIEQGEDLGSKYTYNKDGVTLNKKFKRLHAWLDECLSRPSKMPVGKERMEMLEKMVENLMKMQPFLDMGSEDTLAEILPACNFQVPFVWYAGKMRKKGLADCLIETDETIYVFDIKSAADIARFIWMLKNKYWIQEAHYTAGLQSIFKDKKIVWRFLVSSKAAPYISQPLCVDPYSMSEYGLDAYYDLCNRYQAWTDEGKPPKGWKGLESVKIFFN